MRVAMLSLVLVLTACSATMNDPVGRRFAWLDYVAGTDFARACRGSGLERYRVVFNGEFTHQVRAYDIAEEVDGGAVVLGRVFRGSLMSDAAFPSILQGLVGETARAELDAAAFERFRAGVAQAEPYHGGRPTYLRSDSYFWVVLACRAGRMTAEAFTGPRAVLEALPFREVLLDNDPTGVPLRVQRRVPADSATNYGAAYSPMQEEAIARGQGAVGPAFQFRFQDGRISAVGG